MIKKARIVPHKILILEALLRRLAINHPSRRKIEEELAKSYAGFLGEQYLDRYLSQFPQDDHYIFQDLRLPHSKDGYFQIDTLILSQKYFLILEVKNISGTLYFDFHQLIRKQNDTIDSFADPVLQVQNQQSFFEEFMGKHSLPKLPNTSFVVITNPTSIIEFNPNYREAISKVIRPAAIKPRTDVFYQKHQKDILDKKDIQKLSRLLLRMHTPAESDIVRKLQINEHDFLPGIYCDNCMSLSVEKKQRIWICKNCKTLHKSAHLLSLIDYKLLIGATITSRQLKEFLQLSSRSISSKLLRSLKFPSTGEYKSIVYHLSLKDLQHRVIAHN